MRNNSTIPSLPAAVVWSELVFRRAGSESSFSCWLSSGSTSIIDKLRLWGSLPEADDISDVVCFVLLRVFFSYLAGKMTISTSIGSQMTNDTKIHKPLLALFLLFLLSALSSFLLSRGVQLLSDTSDQAMVDGDIKYRLTFVILGVKVDVFSR